jgi:7-carboxy-7-deazaguanine synthase
MSLMTLRLNEHYVSIQGEGPNVGKITQFIRFSGCNMRCPGWPCDTPHAVQPALWKDDPKVLAKDILNKIAEFVMLRNAQHVCLTGGEPFLQPNDLLREIIQGCAHMGVTVDIFTNGSIGFPSWLFDMRHVTIIMDWKLPGSGEADFRVEERLINARLLRKTDAIKFVCKDQTDLQAIPDLECSAIRYVGTAWGWLGIDFLLEYIEQQKGDWRLNIQLHKYLWGEARGV